jgi:uncharacterized protein YtpQ (UPF0354 family)
MCAQVTQKSFKFAEKHGCPFFFVSASDGTNVVRIFNEAILQGAQHWRLVLLQGRCVITMYHFAMRKSGGFCSFHFSVIR